MVRILVLIALVVLAGSAYAENVDISFPGLTGEYETGWQLPNSAPNSRMTTFIFPPDVQSMDGMRLIVSGSFDEGEVVCSGPFGTPDTTSFVPDLTVILQAPGVFDGFYYATIAPQAGHFSHLSAFLQYCCPSGPGNPNQLLGEIITAEFSCGYPLILPCNIDVDSIGVLTEVRLQALGAVPDDGISWGRVKALFR